MKVKAIAYDPQGRRLPYDDLETILAAIRIRVGPKVNYSKTTKNGKTIIHVAGYKIIVL